jgi:outer membrane cobalamin receptor
MNYGVGGALQNSGYFEGSLGYDTDLTDALSASAAVTVGYLTAGGPIQQSGHESGFHNATASAGLSYALNENWSVSGSLTYIQQLDDEVLLDDDQEVHLVGMVGVACDF